MTKQKKRAYLVFSFLLILFVYLALETIELARYKRDLDINSLLPNVAFTTLDGKDLELHSLTSKKSIAILFFSTECPFCQKEIASIEKHPSLLDSLSLVLVTQQDGEEVKAFMKDFTKINTKAFILLDKNEVFLKHFGSSTVPNMFIYRDKKLVKNLKGLFDPENLKQF